MIDVPAQDCEHTHALVSALRGVRTVMRDPRPLTRRRGAHAWHFIRCARTPGVATRARRAHIRWLGWRREHRWLLRWERLPEWARSWADSTAFCETGGTMNPRAVSPTGQYRGLMQFDYGTWHEAGGSGDPIDASANEQKVRGVRLMLRVGRGRWPRCG